MHALLLILSTGAAGEAATLLERAEAALADGDTSAASALVLQALAADPESVEAQKAAALLAAEQQDWSAAAGHLEALLALDPLDDEARLLLARARWRAGDGGSATRIVERLLADLPGDAGALDLRQRINSGAAAEGAEWRPMLRLGLGMGWDSNVAQISGAAPEASRASAAAGSLEAVGGLLRAGGDWPVTLLAHAGAQSSFADRASTEMLMPSFAGGSFTARRRGELLQLAADLRYLELWSETFRTHRERLLSPAVWGSYALSSGHALRLLGGAEVRRTEAGVASVTGIAPHVGLRDEMSLGGGAAAAAEVAARRNMARSEATIPESLGDFDELRAMLYGEYRLTAELDAFGAASVEGRAFAAGPRETTWRAQLGARWQVGDFEVRGEYGFAKNLAKPARSYGRHQIGLGLRFWYF